MPASFSPDVIVFGGGAAGLWLLSELLDRGYDAVVLETRALGTGQTIASQGIVHGGFKYALGPRASRAARSIREMPLVWRRCLAGETRPDLTATRRRAEFCHLWRTHAISSRFAMAGARAGLRVAPTSIDHEARPRPLRECPGLVARIDEQVVEPGSLLLTLADRVAGRVLKIDARSGLDILTSSSGSIETIRLINPATGEPIDLHPARTVFTAGAGNAALRTRVGLAASAQRRPLHMVVVRGTLPVLNGHCVDGLATRATISTTHDYADRAVWQVGGQIAEDGVAMDASELITHARRELASILPGHDLAGYEWTTYRVDRAEGHLRSGRRPNAETVLVDGNTITGWPTKLALVPRLVERIIARLDPPTGPPTATPPIVDWPRPELAVVPWEEDEAWVTID